MSEQHYDAIFFDLDGTLLPMEIDVFLSRYFHDVARYFAQLGISTDAFVPALKKGVHVMQNHEAGILNSDAFWTTFNASIAQSGVHQPDGWFEDRFMDFYREPFGTIGHDVVPNPAAARAVQTLADKGYTLFCTTMPLFPRVAVEWRLRWSGVDASLFERITTYDNSTDVKPSGAYYLQNVQEAGVPAHRVLMVGNNTEDDLSSIGVGLDAFLVTDHLLNPNDYDIETVKHGTMADFAAFAETMPEYTR